MTLTAIYALVFVSTLLIVDVILRGLRRMARSSREINARLNYLKKTDDHGAVYKRLVDERGIRKASDRSMFSFVEFLRRLYTQSGLHLSKSRRIFYVLSFMVIGAVIGNVILPNILELQVVFSVAVAILTTLGFLVVKRHQRRRKFLNQLAPSIDIVVRSLHAGHPLTSAISLVAREMPDPIGTEFGVLSDQLTFGARLDDGMLNMVERVGVPDLKLLATTVTVQKGTGGNLAEILQNLAQMIRDRLMLKQKIRAISAEGRFTSVIMLLFPFLLFGMVFTLVPTYFDPLWATGYGPHVVIVCLFMMFCAMIILNRLVNFDF